jgi:DNA polymerase
MLWAYAFDDGPVSVWDVTASAPMPVDLAAALADGDCLLYFHNSHFDRTVIRHALGIDIPIERWRCSMVRALAHSLPGSLDKLCEILEVPQDARKLKTGEELVNLFCKPRPKNSKIRRATRKTHPEEWKLFMDYCGMDVVAMRECCKRMPEWNYKGKELALWHLDQVINSRGFAVDVELAEAAVRAIDIEQTRLAGAAWAHTDGALNAATQRDAMLEHILAEYGISLPDMRASTLERRLDDPDIPEALKELLRIRLQASTTSTSKYRAVIRGQTGGRLRGTLQFDGAGRTGRWAGRTFQPQNLPRVPKYIKPQWEDTVTAIKAGVVDMLFDNPMEAMGSLVRGIIIAPPGLKLVVADLSNIEGRMLAWLAGEEWKLKAFRDFDNGIGADLYKLAYAKSFNVPVEEVGDEERQIGKVEELMLGYEGGVGAFLTGAATYGFDVEDLGLRAYGTLPDWAREEAHDFYAWAVKQKRSTFGLSERAFVTCDGIKRLWRSAHPNIASLWKGLQAACIRAVEWPGQTLTEGVYEWGGRTFTVPLRVKVRRDGAWLRVVLPSGRALCYPQPKIEDGKLTYMGVHQYTRKWTRLKTYGGKLCIAGGTLVLTYRGWVPIEMVDSLDLVWDGVDWVRTEGCIGKGVREVIEAYGASMTPDHLVLSMEGWICASQSERYQRAACRIPYGCEIPRQRWKEVVMVDALRLRDREDHASERTHEAEGAGDRRFLRVHEVGNHRRQEHDARHEQPSGLRGMAQHDRPMPTPDAPGVEELRRPRHHCLRALARIVRKLLGRYGPDLSARPGTGPGGQRRGLFAGKLPVDNAESASQQHPAQSQNRRQDGIATGRSARREAFDDVLPTGSGRADREAGGNPRRVAQVFDLLNCGPRQRFVIWAGGAPLVVHNCENITQAAARDVLAGSMPEVEAAGYQIVLTVHDEIITETPDSPEFTADRLAEIMSRSPEWAPDIPLAAAGFEAYRYRKG